MRDANIVTLHKNKGDRSDCNNYRGISLLSIAGKLFARVVLKRLQILAETLYPESQYSAASGQKGQPSIWYFLCANYRRNAGNRDNHFI